jgi:hypothetical protein
LLYGFDGLFQSITVMIKFYGSMIRKCYLSIFDCQGREITQSSPLIQQFFHGQRTVSNRFDLNQEPGNYDIIQYKNYIIVIGVMGHMVTNFRKH